MNTLLLPISQHVQQSGMNINVVSTAAGLAISRHLQLPTSEVESINMHYVSQVQQNVGMYLSMINESVIINMECSFKVARSAYMLRYNVAYPKSDGSVILPSNGSFFEQLLGVDTYFDQTTKDCCQSKCNEIITLTNRFLAILPELIKQ